MDKNMRVVVRQLGEKSGTKDIEIDVSKLMSMRFLFDDGQEISIKDGGDGLRIFSVNGRLKIEPEASNIVQISEIR